MRKNLKHFFLYYKIKYFKSSVVNTILATKISPQNIGGKLLKVGKKKKRVIY